MQRYSYLNSWMAALLALSALTAHGGETQTQQTQANSADSATSAQQPGDYTLGPGDVIRILVFQNPDLTLDTRVSESGTIHYPLIGNVKVGGLPLGEASRVIASELKEGGFVQQPQVNILLLEVQGNQVSVLGEVNRPGRFPLETFNTRLSEMLAIAGGINSSIGPNGGGSDVVIVSGMRNGEPFRKEIDIPSLFLDNQPENDIIVSGGDVIYVPPAPLYYIYGEAQRPGSFRIRRDMTMQQALAEAGGVSLRGTQRGIKLYRRNAQGEVEVVEAMPNDLVQPNDVIFVTESLF
jgi:polysaccharide export outer membrane protein